MDDLAGTAPAQEAPAQRHTPAAVADGTGHPRVDAVVERLRGTAELGVEEHVRVYEEAHEELRAVLGDLDAAEDGS